MLLTTCLLINCLREGLMVSWRLTRQRGAESPSGVPRKMPREMTSLVELPEVVAGG
jgi:hypothetical protein